MSSSGAHIGVVVTSEEIRAAAGGKTEWARRVRELRGEEGWPILTHNDSADLEPGEYVLREQPPVKRDIAFARGISNKLRAEVLDRNGFTCQMLRPDSERYRPKHRKECAASHRPHRGQKSRWSGCTCKPSRPLLDVQRRRQERHRSKAKHHMAPLSNQTCRSRRAAGCFRVAPHKVRCLKNSRSCSEAQICAPSRSGTPRRSWWFESSRTG